MRTSPVSYTHLDVYKRQVEEDPTAEKQAIKNRHTEEVEAESISYAVCKYFGIETGENSFGYIASWSQGKELKELRASLETINKTSGILRQAGTPRCRRQAGCRQGGSINLNG